MVAREAEPGEVESAVEDVMGNFIIGKKFGGLGGDLTGEELGRGSFLGAAGENPGGEIAPVVEAFAIGSNVTSGMIGEAEVGEKETLGLELTDGV